VWEETNPWRREASDHGKCSVGEGNPARKVGPGVEGWGEDEVKPPQAGLGIKDLSLAVDRDSAGGLILPRSFQVDEFCFWNGEGGVAWGCFVTEGGEDLLQEVDVRSGGGKRNLDGEVVHIEDGQTTRNVSMERGHIYDKQEG